MNGGTSAPWGALLCCFGAYPKSNKAKFPVVIPAEAGIQ
jgi:hypothetical protein